MGANAISRPTPACTRSARSKRSDNRCSTDRRQHRGLSRPGNDRPAPRAAPSARASWTTCGLQRPHCRRRGRQELWRPTPDKARHRQAMGGRRQAPVREPGHQPAPEPGAEPGQQPGQKPAHEPGGEASPGRAARCPGRVNIPHTSRAPPSRTPRICASDITREERGRPWLVQLSRRRVPGAACSPGAVARSGTGRRR